jgi:hypothetical protein
MKTSSQVRRTHNAFNRWNTSAAGNTSEIIEIFIEDLSSPLPELEIFVIEESPSQQSSYSPWCPSMTPTSSARASRPRVLGTTATGQIVTVTGGTSIASHPVVTGSMPSSFTTTLPKANAPAFTGEADSLYTIQGSLVLLAFVFFFMLRL